MGGARKTKGTATGVTRWVASRRFDIKAEGAHFALLSTGFGSEDQVVATWPASVAELKDEWGEDVMFAARTEADGLGEAVAFRLVYLDGEGRSAGQYRIRVVPDDASGDAPTDQQAVIAMLMQERKHMQGELLAATRLVVTNTQAVLQRYEGLVSTVLERATLLESERTKVLEAQRDIMEAEIAAGADLENQERKAAREERLFQKGEKILDIAAASIMRPPTPKETAKAAARIVRGKGAQARHDAGKPNPEPARQLPPEPPEGRA